jgi:hypothetical protein
MPSAMCRTRSSTVACDSDRHAPPTLCMSAFGIARDSMALKNSAFTVPGASMRGPPLAYRLGAGTEESVLASDA